MNVRVEYEPIHVRHIAVQCVKCNNWFDARDITDNVLEGSSDIYYAQFECPVCGRVFGANNYERFENVKIEEVNGVEVYAGCLKKKEVWG